MNYRKSYNTGGSPFGGITGLIMAAVVILGLFFVTRGIFFLLSKVAIFLFIATLVIDHKVVLNYAKWILSFFTRGNADGIVKGIVGVVLTILGFQVVAAFLFGKALLKRKIKKVEEEITRQREGEFTTYEEVDDQPLELKDFDIETKQKDNEYDDLFNE